MRILFVTSTYPSRPGDAKGVFIYRFSRGLRDAGVDVTVLAPGVPGAAKRLIIDGVPVERATYWLPRF